MKYKILNFGAKFQFTTKFKNAIVKQFYLFPFQIAQNDEHIRYAASYWICLHYTFTLDLHVTFCIQVMNIAMNTIKMVQKFDFNTLCGYVKPLQHWTINF